ncbi:MAG: hypothetical protein HC846_13505, partial [Blastocatellia bacterium]|nr:hypothetical protein [Blastocatellia bacterium]
DALDARISAVFLRGNLKKRGSLPVHSRHFALDFEGFPQSETLALPLSGFWNRKGLISEKGERKPAFKTLADWYKRIADEEKRTAQK